MDDELCTCGHLLGEHETVWDGNDAEDLTPYWACTRCDCADFHNVKHPD